MVKRGEWSRTAIEAAEETAGQIIEFGQEVFGPNVERTVSEGDRCRIVMRVGMKEQRR